MMEKHPFPDLKISNSDFFDELEGRQKCPKCQKSRKFYCYSCYIPLSGTEDKIPRIQLPIQIDIIKHRQEVDGKSTSGHAALVAPDHVTIYTYPTIPEYKDTSKVLLVFPGPDALTLEEYVTKFSVALKHITATVSRETESNISQESNLSRESMISQESNILIETKIQGELNISPELKIAQASNILQSQNQSVSGSTKFSCSSEEPNKNDCSIGAATCLVAKKSRYSISSGCEQQCIDTCVRYKRTFEKVVFIDSTWRQVSKIRYDKRLIGLQKVEIKAHTTKFWRHQRGKPRTYLATIEAIYYFLREYHDLFEVAPYTGTYDDLLFFFTFMYRKVRFEFEKGKVLKAYEHEEKIC